MNAAPNISMHYKHNFDRQTSILTKSSLTSGYNYFVSAGKFSWQGIQYKIKLANNINRTSVNLLTLSLKMKHYCICIIVDEFEILFLYNTAVIIIVAEYVLPDPVKQGIPHDTGSIYAYGQKIVTRLAQMCKSSYPGL